ncbi:MAG: cysteine--tRNA ligase [Clostridiales bacterium]|jgi:cysteinyl-tRNA synthetase|nr:cysteine--tRNA ligase [Clostridiales bacterium]
MLKIYNTLTRRKEEFVPIDGEGVRMYSCGPTVYSYAHIGNFRTYVFTDLLRRVLKYDGFKINGIMNITDVGHLLSDGDTGEDKMQKSAREQNKSPYEIAEFYTKAFLTDIEKLNIDMPERLVKATDHIADMIEYVKELEKKGYAYEISDGIYFDIAKFSGYGKLSGVNLDEQIAGSRVEVNSEKHGPYDFALWKKAEKEHIMQWDSPWGMGYPGWHIECSAMSIKYLGRHFDIHTGGVDHVPIHHENEIAQNEAMTGEKSVNYWIHSEFLLVDNGKMSKSLKNNYTVSDLEQRGYTALDYRFFCLNAHYRKKLNFTFEGMDGAKTALVRLKKAVAEHKNGTEKIDSEVLTEYKREFEKAINDDLNIPLALGVLFKLIKEKKSAEIYRVILDTDRIFGLKLDEEIQEDAATEAPPVPTEITALAEERKAAKAAKDYAKADEVRKRIEEKGYRVADTKEGYSILKVEN